MCLDCKYESHCYWLCVKQFPCCLNLHFPIPQSVSTKGVVKEVSYWVEDVYWVDALSKIGTGFQLHSVRLEANPDIVRNWLGWSVLTHVESGTSLKICFDSNTILFTVRNGALNSEDRALFFLCIYGSWIFIDTVRDLVVGTPTFDLEIALTSFTLRVLLLLYKTNFIAAGIQCYICSY